MYTQTSCIGEAETCRQKKSEMFSNHVIVLQILWNICVHHYFGIMIEIRLTASLVP